MRLGPAHRSLITRGCCPAPLRPIPSAQLPPAQPRPAPPGPARLHAERWAPSRRRPAGRAGGPGSPEAKPDGPHPRTPAALPGRAAWPSGLQPPSLDGNSSCPHRPHPPPLPARSGPSSPPSMRVSVCLPASAAPGCTRLHQPGVHAHTLLTAYSPCCCWPPRPTPNRHPLGLLWALPGPAGVRPVVGGRVRAAPGPRGERAG